MSRAAGSVADATGNWVDTLAPAWLRPYLRLARLDRPIGSWLLLLPCWWSSALAAIAASWRLPNLWHIALFFVGAYPIRPGQRHPSRRVFDRTVTGRACSAARAQRIYRRAWHRLAGDRRDLSVYEADHLLAADRSRPGFLVGGADGLGRHVRPARYSGAVALCRIDRLGDRLRHDLCSPGSRRRRTDRNQIHGVVIRTADQADACSVLRRCRRSRRRRRLYRRCRTGLRAGTTRFRRASFLASCAARY